MTAQASSGTQETMAKSHGQARNRLASRRALLTKGRQKLVMPRCRAVGSLHQHTHAGARAVDARQWPGLDLKGTGIKTLPGTGGAPGGEIGQDCGALFVKAKNR